MPKPSYPLRDVKGFLKVFRKETDRACAVLARALMDELLGRLLAAHFVEGFDSKRLLEYPAALSAYASRILVSRAIGLIADDEAADLALVKDVGNDFAHGLDHEMTFEDPSIRKRVFAISAAKAIVEFPQLYKQATHLRFQGASEDPRLYFELSVVVLIHTLDLRARKVPRVDVPQSFLATLRCSPNPDTMWNPYPSS